jgi:hypothetical protein
MGIVVSFRAGIRIGIDGEACFDIDPDCDPDASPDVQIDSME